MNKIESLKEKEKNAAAAFSNAEREEREFQYFQELNQTNKKSFKTLRKLQAAKTAWLQAHRELHKYLGKTA